jgi:hypothetical protein
MMRRRSRTRGGAATITQDHPTAMEAPEVPLEETQEHIHHTASHGRGHGPHAPERWTMGVALSTALFAALAAIASLIAGQKANEAMVAQIESANQWSYYQSKSIKANLLDSKDELLVALGHAPEAKDDKKRKEYDADKEAIREAAEEKEAEAKHELAGHEWLARAVTMFQLAIALAAIAVLTRLRLFWMIGIGLGTVGIGFFATGFLIPPVVPHGGHHEPAPSAASAEKSADHAVH